MSTVWFEHNRLKNRKFTLKSYLLSWKSKIYLAGRQISKIFYFKLDVDVDPFALKMFAEFRGTIYWQKNVARKHELKFFHKVDFVCDEHGTR